MTRIETYVFFDLETTGLPKEERNRTKITDLCFIVTSRNDIESTKHGDTPPVCKLCLLFKPEKEVNPKAARITGLTSEYLKNCCTFSEKINTIIAFLNDVKKPICLIAHNGNCFDFKILLMEFASAGRSLPEDLLCVDSLIGFRKLLKGTQINYIKLKTQDDDEITDDEDESWPALNISNNDWNEIDSLSTSLCEMSFENTKISAPNQKESFNLSDIYKRLLNKEVTDAHRAEVDCFMLLESVVAIKHLFLPWADVNFRNLNEIVPFKPY